MKYILIFFVIFLLVILPLSPQEKVEEQVKVDWWVVPIFAVDRSGKPVLDLKPEDISLRVDNEAITGFTFYKRIFTVDQRLEEKAPLPTFAQRKRMVFFMFDNVFSTQTNYELSKAVAKDLVAKAEQGTLFTIMVIDAFKGPVHAGGPTEDKKQLLKLIDEKVVWDPDGRDYQTVYQVVYENIQQTGTPHAGSGVQSKYEGEKELGVFTDIIGSWIRRSDQRYFLSFQDLYHMLNSIKDNKFVYLFSEGLALYARRVVKYGEEEYYQRLKQTADYLSRSGAVLFIVNPTGALSNLPYTGEDTMRFLARESGGKYMEGDKETISTRLEQMHRAYYEFAFPDQAEFSGEISNITLRSKRRGVRLHSLRSLEKEKTYAEMKEIEKEILVLNLLNTNPLFRFPLESRPLRIEKLEQKGDTIHYQIKLPADFQGRVLDLYKVWYDEEKGEANVEKETINPRESTLNLSLKQKGKASSYLVLINEKEKAALVQGKIDFEADRKEILAESASSFKKKLGRMSLDKRQELDTILAGAAGYCRQLEGAILHYFCKETVAEVLEILRSHKAEKESTYSDWTGITYGLSDVRGGGSEVRVIKRKVTNKYVFDYQLVRSKYRIQEQRKLLQGDEKKLAGAGGALKLDTFISSKIPVAPLTMLAAERQKNYDYRFVKYDKLKGVKTALIECFPKDARDTTSSYGKLWIDMNDYSVVRMSINPVSIGGYPMLLKLARDFESKLTLTCQIDFLKVHNGLRFPTSIDIRERYAGGSLLRRLVGAINWERSKTIYKFDDYKFFEVSVTSEAEYKK